MSRVGKWTPKLTDESRLYAMQRLAQDISSIQVVKELLQKYDITISDARIRMVRDSKKWFPIYQKNRELFLKKVVDSKGIDIESKAHRLKSADHIAKKLMRLIDKVEVKIDELTKDGIKEDTMKYVYGMIKTLRETAKIYKDFLSYAKDEMKEEPDKGKLLPQSFLTQINLHTDGQAHKVIDVEEINAEPKISSDNAK